MKNKKTVTPYVKQFYRGSSLNLTLSVFVIILTTACSILISWLIQQFVDLMGGYDTGFDIWQLIAISAIGLIVFILASFISYHTKPKIIAKGISNYKEYLFNKLTKKNISSFYGENSAVYLSALTNDIQVIEKGYLENIFVIIENVLLFVSALGLMLWYSPLLTAIAIALSLLPIIAAIFTGNKMATAEKKTAEKNIEYTSTLKDCIGGFPVIKSFKAELQMIKLFKSNLSELANVQIKKHKLNILIMALASIAGIIAQLGVFIFGAYLAITNKSITAGTTMIFVQLMNYVLQPIGTLPTCFAEMQSARALIEKVAAMVDTNVSNDGNKVIEKIEQGITLQNLSFSYEEEKPVLNGLNFKFERGKKYAIVGASGSGKSTLLNILMASSKNYTGNILYDNTPLKDINTDSLYEIQSIIQQNVFLFNASLLENVTMFKQFSFEKVNSALSLSGLDDLVSEKGLSYPCGENGNNLSGGEKQRISIARSLLKNSKILLVDEATSSLDAKTAYQISNSILALEGVTAIVVTHSLEEDLLEQYDCILYMKNGTVAESGNFDSLMQKKGLFYSLFTLSQ